jgi:hypothetical protein
MAADSLTTQEKVLEHITVSQAAMQKNAAYRAAVEADRAKAASKIRSVFETLLANERVLPGDYEKVASACSTLSGAMDLIIDVAKHQNASELARLTAPNATTKKASYDPSQSLTSPYVGEKTKRLKQSDVSLLRGLGLAVPQQ